MTGEPAIGEPIAAEPVTAGPVATKPPTVVEDDLAMAGPADPADRDSPMPLDTLITGRIATLAGDVGLRLGRGGRDPRRPDRVRRLRGRPRDAGRPAHAAASHLEPGRGRRSRD